VELSVELFASPTELLRIVLLAVVVVSAFLIASDTAKAPPPVAALQTVPHNTRARRPYSNIRPIDWNSVVLLMVLLRLVAICFHAPQH
jgi:hypothetical protein